jgi:hypothetical protein
MAYTTMFDRILFGPNDGAGYFGSRKTALDTTAPDEEHVTQHPKQYINAKEIESSPAESPTVRVPDNPIQSTSSKRSKGVMSHWQQLSQRHQNTWNPSVLQMRSVVGLSALCVVISCMLASLAVLVISDNSPVDHWPIQPTVRNPTSETSCS